MRPSTPHETGLRDLAVVILDIRGVMHGTVKCFEADLKIEISRFLLKTGGCGLSINYWRPSETADNVFSLQWMANETLTAFYLPGEWENVLQRTVTALGF